MKKRSFITVTDQFCGAGGSSIGATKAGAELRLALNHWQLAIDTHNTNFPKADHDCTDISACDPRRYPSTDILITSPECFPAGTLILTSAGMVPIEQVNIGDLVLTHLNRWRSVVRKQSRIADRHSQALVMPFLTSYYGSGQNSSCDGPMPTVTTRDRHALVVPPFIVNMQAHNAATAMHEPIRTILTGPHKYLVHPGKGSPPAVDDCGFRMLAPAECGAGMGFPSTYQVLGGSRDLSRVANDRRRAEDDEQDAKDRRHDRRVVYRHAQQPHGGDDGGDQE